MVKVLVGKKKRSKFPGFWAEFDGKEVSRYEDPRDGRKTVYTLYECTAYNFDAYRVHVADESNPDDPVYELKPSEQDPSIQGVGPDYSEAWDKNQVAAFYPMFLKDMDYFRTVNVDPVRRR